MDASSAAASVRSDAESDCGPNYARRAKAQACDVGLTIELA